MSFHDLHSAAITKGDIVKPQVHESELKRCTATMDDVDVSLVLTNQRILLCSKGDADTTMDTETPVEIKEISLSALSKAKSHKAGLLKRKKACPTLVLKTTNDTKYEIGFLPRTNTIYTPAEERDDCLRLIQEYLKIRNPVG